jgi:hypothetical protein
VQGETPAMHPNFRTGRAATRAWLYDNAWPEVGGTEVVAMGIKETRVGLELGKAEVRAEDVEVKLTR